MEMTPEIEEKWREIVAKSWVDAKFKESLLDNPNQVLSENGVDVPGNINFVVVENEPDRLHLVLPSAPSDVSVESVDRSSVSDYDPGF